MNNKIIKIIFKTIGIFILAILLLLLTTGILLQFEPIQSYIAKIAINKLSTHTNYDFSIENLKIKGLSTIEINDLHVKDKHNKTMFDIGQVKFRIKSIELSQNTFYLKEVIARNIYCEHIKYDGDTISNLKDLIISFSNNNKKEKKKHHKPFTLLADYIRLHNINYKYKNEEHVRNRVRESIDVDFKDVEVTDIYGELMDFSVVGDSITAEMLNFAFKERCGLELRNLTADVCYTKQLIAAHKALLLTSNSKLIMDLEMKYHNMAAFKQFLDSVSFDATLMKDSKVNLIDIGYFASQLACANNLIEINAKVDGPVNNMAITNAEIALCDTTYYAGDVFLHNVNKKNIGIGLNISKFTTDGKDIETIVVPGFLKDSCNAKRIIMPQQVHDLNLVSMSGAFKGSFKDIKANLNIFTDAGNIQLIANYDEKHTSENNFNINLIGDDIAIGKILNINDKISTIDADISAKGIAKEFIPKTYKVKATLDDVSLSKVSLDDIYINAENDGEMISSSLSVFNENIFMQLYASYIPDPTLPILNSSLDFNHINLNKLDLTKSKDQYELSGFINLNAVGKQLDDIDGQINVSELKVKLNDTEHDLQDLSFSVIADSNAKDINLNSNIIDINMKGDFMYADLSPTVGNIINKITYKDTKNEYTQPIYLSDNTNINVSAKLKNIKLFTDIFIPELAIAPNSTIKLNTQSTKQAQLEANIDYLKFKNTKANKLYLDFNYDSIRILNELSIAKLILDENEGKHNDLLDFSNIKLQNTLQEDTITTTLNWFDSIFYNKSEIKLKGNISKLPNFSAEILSPTKVSLLENEWNITTDGCIVYTPDIISVDKLQIQCDSTIIQLDGKLSNNVNDSLNAIFNNINLSPVNFFTPEDINIKGSLDGTVSLSKLDKSPFISSELLVSDIFINKEHLGNLVLRSHWDNYIQNILANAYIIQSGNISSDTVINLEARYAPFSKAGDIDGRLKFSNLDFKFLSPFLQNIISNPYGSISGGLDISNNISDPIIAGNLKFRRSGLTVNFTGATYTFSNELKIKPHAVLFDNFRLYDDNGQYFDLSGEITHKRFKDININLNTIFNDFIFLDNRPTIENSLFYGKTILSGTAGLKGKLDNISISADVATVEGTDINLELSAGKTASEFSFIHFIDPNDTIQKLFSSTNKGGIDINAKADIMPNAKLHIVLPYSVGDMTITGNGNVRYKQQRDGNMTVIGDYNIQYGELDVNFQNMLKRKFIIKEGGSITFNGDPMDAVMNLEAIYQVRAPLSGIPTITDPTLTERKVTVNCIIKFNGVLTNPEISYELTFPKLEENIQSLINSAIDMNDQAAVSEQVFSLLVMKTFMFSTDNTMLASGLGANSLDFISGQISNWLSLISKNIDIDVNYNEASDFNAEEVEISVKTTLFDDRLIINSNIGLQGETPTGISSNTSSIVGDFDAEYKITKDGLLRAKVFNRSNDYNLLEPNAPYTQGVGILYHTEFDKISELRRKKRRYK